MARQSDNVGSSDTGRHEVSESDARDAIRAAQRIASQLHQLIAASLTVAGLRNERDIVESLAGSARRVFDADDAVLSLETGAAAPLYGVARRSRLVTSFDSDEDHDLDFPSAQGGTSAPWADGGWLVSPIVEGRSEARGVLAVRRSAVEFNNEDREVLTLLAQMAATALGATELSREIENSETRLRTLVDTAPAGIVEVGFEGTVRWWNRAARQIFDWPAYELGVETAPTFPESATADLGALWSEVRKQSAPANRDLIDIEIRGRRRDLTASAVLLASQESPSILMLVDDVTEHRQLKAEVNHAQQMEIRGRVASSVAHDFNNLLTLISGYAEILTSELGANHASLEMVKDIQSTASRASTLTAQLQTIGRSPSLDPIVVDPVAMLESAANVIERIVGESIATEWVLDPDAGTILVDSGQFEQMMLNLAINARDAMPSGGTLRIVVEGRDVEGDRATELNVEPGRYVAIHVIDSGVGMDAETLAKCFDTFFTTKGPYKGTGMGLAAARRLVEGSRGTITAASAPGAGTDFEILFPATRNAEPTAEPRRIVRPVQTATVLIAEDDDDLRRLMSQILQRNGFDVLVSASGESALLESRSFPGIIDLLVSDVMMRKLSGPELAGIVQGERPELRVLLISGTADQSVTEHLKRGTSAFLAKPFRPSEFVDIVQRVLTSDSVDD